MINSKPYLVYGKHTVKAALQNPKRIVKKVFITDRSFLPELHNSKYSIELLTNTELEMKLERGAVHQGIAAEVMPLSKIDLDVFLKNLQKNKAIIILLDQIKDPQNFGNIIRSSAAFDVDAIIVTNRNMPKENATIAKVASGALEIVPIIEVANLRYTIDKLKKYHFWILGLDSQTDKRIEDIPNFDKTAVIMGSENKGMRNINKNNVDLMVSIKTSRSVESLNVHAATAIVLQHLYSKSEHAI